MMCVVSPILEVNVLAHAGQVNLVELVSFVLSPFDRFAGGFRSSGALKPPHLWALGFLSSILSKSGLSQYFWQSWEFMAVADFEIYDNGWRGDRNI